MVLTLAGNVDQVEFQGAKGVSDNIAIKANCRIFIPADLDNGNGGSGKFLEVGGGYYGQIQEYLIFEAYGIVGFGSVENHLINGSGPNVSKQGDLSANIFRWGVQPNLGYNGRILKQRHLPG